VPVPAVIVGGDAVTLDRDEESAPAVTVTVAVCVTPTLLIVAETVFAPASVELSVPVPMPLASVGTAGWLSVLPLPVHPRTTVAPTSGLSCASRAVTVMVAPPPPAAIVGGAALTVDCAAETAPLVTVTVAV